MARRTILVVMSFAVVFAFAARPSRAAKPAKQAPYLQISGIYPHLATHNQPEDMEDRPNHGECGTGAIVPWAGRLWYISYPQHKTTGSNDKLYEVDTNMHLTIRPESVGGTHACRMIHKESNQLIIGPYFIDALGNVRSPDLKQLRGRMTAVMRHLTDPANKVYFFDMEGAIYEVDVHTLAVKRLFSKPVPGWHGKGGYTAQGRVVIANNGERDAAPSAYKNLKVGGPPANEEEAGVLAEWDGEEWRIVDRKKYCDVTGPGGIYGSPDATSPLWAIGWDKRSVILKLLDHGEWFTFRIPKASHTFDHNHGWYTEWPRIRAIAPGKPAMCMHASLIDFPIGFNARDTSGLRPICSHLRYIPDIGYWHDRVFLGADDSSMMGNPMCGQGQSNIWFGAREQLESFGHRAGWGGPWLSDAVKAGEASTPYMFAGYKQRVVHIVNESPEPVRFDMQVDKMGDGRWSPVDSMDVPAGEYRYHVFPARVKGEWIRLKADRDCKATAYFHYWSPRPWQWRESRIFNTLAEVDSSDGYVAGLIRPAAHNRGLQWLRVNVSDSGKARPPHYIEVTLSGATGLIFNGRPQEDRSDEVLKVTKIKRDFDVDAASVVVTDWKGRRFRIPKGPDAFDKPFTTGWPRAIREVVSERWLANIHGTFYEIPRGSDNHSPDFQRMKPVSSHNKRIIDFCTWRGLLVMTGTRAGAKADGQFFGGLWFGAVDDLWKLGKPVGRGGPWSDTTVEAGKPSEPYLMTGYDKKRLTLSHDSGGPVIFRVEVDFDHTGFRKYDGIVVLAGQKATYRFPRGFHAHWVRLTANKDCRATATFTYE